MSFVVISYSLLLGELAKWKPCNLSPSCVWCFSIEIKDSFIHGSGWQSSSTVKKTFSGNAEGFISGRTSVKRCCWNLYEKQIANSCNSAERPPEGGVCLQLLLCLLSSHYYQRILSPYDLACLWISVSSVSVFNPPYDWDFFFHVFPNHWLKNKQTNIVQ